MIDRLFVAAFMFTLAKCKCYDDVTMIANLVPTITALEAQAAANLFLSDNLPDRLCADDPCLDTSSNLWRVAVLLTYPFIGSVGEVGEITVSTSSEEIISHTPLNEMRSRALSLYEQHREAIQTAFLQSRNG